MAIIQATPLTVHQQIGIDNVIRDILIEWPDLVYGEFEGSDGEYQITVTQNQQGMETGKPFACTEEQETAEAMPADDRWDVK